MCRRWNQREESCFLTQVTYKYSNKTLTKNSLKKAISAGGILPPPLTSLTLSVLPFPVRRIATWRPGNASQERQRIRGGHSRQGKRKQGVGRQAL